MRLRLVRKTPSQEPGEKGWRLLEHGELTLGRSGGCDWVLADPDRTISGVHCRITRDALGFSLKDESTNGISLDNRALAQGETARLKDGAVIAFCGQRFGVEITGEVEPDWVEPDQSLQLGDEVPSISAILADVSPVGRTATGILPGRLGDDWLEGREEKASVEPTETRISRAPIGWGGPPDSRILANGGGLPDDWDTEVTTSSRSEHVIATSTRVRIPTPARPAETVPVAEAPAHGADDALDAFLRGLGETGEVIEDPLSYLRRMGTELHALRSALREMEREMRELVEELDERPSAPPASGLVARLTEARKQRERLVDAVRELLRETDKLEPDAIERRSLLENDQPGTLTERLNPTATKLRRTWALFDKTYRGAVSDGSPRNRFTARLMGTSTPVDDEFEELRADRPREGGKVA